MGYYLALKWQKTKYVKIIVTLMDVSYMFENQFGELLKSKLGESQRFTVRKSGKSMNKLDEVLKQTKEHILVR